MKKEISKSKFYLYLIIAAVIFFIIGVFSATLFQVTLFGYKNYATNIKLSPPSSLGENNFQPIPEENNFQPVPKKELKRFLKANVGISHCILMPALYDWGVCDSLPGTSPYYCLFGNGRIVCCEDTAQGRRCYV